MTSTVRLLVLSLFVLGMPILALPRVLGYVTGVDRQDGPAGSTSIGPRLELTASTPPRPIRPAEPPARSPGPTRPAPDSEDPYAAPSPTPGNPFPTASARRRADAVQQRLQALGARAFRLVHLPGQQPAYRAECEVELPETPALGKPFEAGGERPLEALERMLAAVERWQLRVAEVSRLRQ